MFTFEKPTPVSRDPEPRLEDFFNDQDMVTSLVRESLQNVLDAHTKKNEEPVRARFSFRTIDRNEFEKYSNTSDGCTLEDHLNSETLGRFAQKLPETQLRTLIIEDYNTTGITGDFDKFAPNSTSNLVNFWWKSGKGNKGTGGTNGSAGIGKICFIIASTINTMYAVSRRLGDETYPKVLLGTTILPSHHINGVSYRGSGQFGTEVMNPETGQETFEPIIDSKYIGEFESCFGISRDNPGLSIVVPGVSEEVTTEAIQSAVLKQYFWAIINKKLIVELVEEDGSTTVLEPDTIRERLASHSSNDKLFARRVELSMEAKMLLDTPSPVVFNGLGPNINEADGTFSFLKEQMTEDNLSSMLSAYDRGDMVRLEFIIPFKKLETNEDKTGFLNLFFKKLENGEEAPKEFIRQSVSITTLERALTRNIPKNIYCFVLIDNNDLSDFVVSAEDPAHIRLTKQKFRKEKLYKPEAALSFIMEAEKFVFAILNRSDEETDFVENFDEEVFSIRLPDDSEDKKSKKKKKKKTKDPDPKIKERSEPIVVQSPLSDKTGVAVRALPALEEFVANKEMTLPITLQIKAAYQTLNGGTEAWKQYSPIDFEIGKDINFSCEPADQVQVISMKDNILKLEISSTEFNIQLTGFDQNRDLIAKTQFL